MPVRVCAVTSTRADYGIMSPLLRRMQADGFFHLTIAATGTHFLPEYGHTVDEIARDGLIPTELPIFSHPPENALDVSFAMAETIRQFSLFFAKHIFDLLVVLGDRSEVAAACCAAVNTRLPIVHLHGGETTEGAIDECYRHAITKMSMFHFTSCEEYRRRVIQLGEQPDRVYNVGALCVENILCSEPYSLELLEQELDLPLRKDPYAIVTFHPVTQESPGAALLQVKELMRAIQQRDDFHYIITKSNADEDGGHINAAWDEFAREHENCRVVASLGMRRYLTVLRGSQMALGNSSSGIIEAPVCRVPSVNIGDRQKGRLRLPSIVDCPPTCEAILEAMQKVSKKIFLEQVQKMPCPYGDGKTSVHIIEILKKRLETKINIQKVFYDFGKIGT